MGERHAEDLLRFDCTFNGCLIEGAERLLYLYAYSGDNLRTVTVQNCHLRDASWSGIYAYNRIRLCCIDTIIEDIQQNGVRFSGNYQGVGNESVIQGGRILDNCSNGNLAEGGVYCYDSDPRLLDAFIYHNADHGVFIYGSTGSDPTIQGNPGNQQANNIINNGTPGSQNGIRGAEIRIADDNSMGGADPISGNNIYDVRNPGGGYVREGFIVAKASGPAVTVINNYLGDDRVQGFNDDASEEDFFSEGDGDIVITFPDDVEENPLPIDKWGETGDSDPMPANRFEEGLFAMRAGELERAVEIFWEWIREEPGSVGNSMLILTNCELRSSGWPKRWKTRVLLWRGWRENCRSSA